MKLIDKHYQELAALPSDLPAYKRILDLVRKGCADTSDWVENAGYRNGVMLLQENLVQRASNIAVRRLSCGGSVTLGVQGTGFSLPFSIPAFGSLSSLIAAGNELRLLWALSNPLPGDDLEAVGLLLQATAEIERALSCPAGFTKRQA